MKRYAIIAVPNPVFNPLRTYMKSGVLMASGSDYGVTSHNPWLGFYALLTRKDQSTGEVYGPEETIGISDALRSTP